jgi:hypothetical protein
MRERENIISAGVIIIMILCGAGRRAQEEREKKRERIERGLKRVWCV